MEENELYDRIGETDLNPNYKDGQVYQHTDINNMLSILKTAVNENYYDIQKLQNGDKTVGNSNKLDNAELSRYIDEPLQADDNKIPSSQQAKAYVDALFSSYSAPVRGVDYWTPEDKQEIIDETSETIEDSIEKEIKYLNQTTSKKYREYNTDYYVIEVPYNDILGNKNVFKVGIANDDINGDLEKTSDFAIRKNAKLCVNAGIFNADTGSAIGLVIKDGVVLASTPYSNVYNYSVLWFDADNNMHFADAQTTTASQLISLGCVNALQGFAKLVEDGELTIDEQYPTVKQPRQVICQKADGSYFFISTGGRDLYNNEGMTYTEVGTIAINLGAVKAYALDGGGSVTTCINMVRQNENIDSTGMNEREVKTYLYLSDIDPEDENTKLLAKEIQKLKQEITEKISHLANGVLKLQGTTSQVGIEFWENLGVNRLGKLSINDSNLVASMLINAVNTVVLRADNTGISDYFGKLAHFYELAPVLTDVDTLESIGTCMYRVRNDASNLPVQGAYGVDLRLAYGTENNLVETFFDMQHQRIFTRFYRSSAWQSWKELGIQNLNGTLYVRNDLTFDNDEDPTTDPVPLVPTDGMINICNGHLKIFADMDGDGDYDADLYSKDNMYLACGNATHIILGQGEDEQTETYGRIVFNSTTNTNFIQSGKNYNGTELKHLAFSPYRSGDYYMIFNKNTGYCGIGKYYSSPLARLHVNSDENTLGIFENHSGTNARIGFKGTSTSSNSDCTIGCESKDLILRAGGEARLRCIADTKHVLPGIASELNLGSSSYPWKDIFSVNSLSVTSDRRSKTDIDNIDEKIFEAWGNLEYKQYKIKNCDGKIHFGIIAQDIVEEFEKVGLNALDYGLVVYDEENDIYNVRYDEVNILENAYIRHKLNS